MGIEHDTEVEARGRWRTAGGLVLVSVAVLAANAWVAVHRMEGFNFRTVAYPTLYYPMERPIVRGFSEDGDGRLRLELGNGEHRDVALERGLHRYSVPIAAGHSFDFDVSYTGSSQTKLFTSSFPVGSYPQYPLAELAPGAAAYAPEHIEAARQILAEAGMQGGGTDEARTEELWKILDGKLRDHMGEPPDGLRKLPILDRYHRVMAGEAQIHCGHSSEIFGLFAAAAGLSSRVVDVNRVVDDVKLTSHTFNEVYLEERGRFAYVDLNLGTLFVRDGRGGTPLNGVELAQRHEAGTLDDLWATRMQGGRLRELPYRDAGRFTRLFLNPNVTFVYHRFYAARHSVPAWLHRYLLRPELAYSLHGGNGRFWLKMALAACGLALVPAWLWFLQRVFSSRRPDPTSG